MHEIHRLLTEKKPFEEHMRLARSRTEELRRQDAAVGRAHSETLRELREKHEEQTRERQGAWREGFAEARKRRADGAAKIATEMRQRQQDYQTARAEMEDRVKSMPALGGEPPARESAARTAQRRQNFEAVKDRTRGYFQDQRAIKDKLNERAMTMSFGPPRRDTAAVVEERKAAGLTQIAAAHREYETQVQALYDKHHSRVWEERKKREEDFQAHLDYRLAARDVAAARHAELQAKIKAECDARDERLKNRSQTFAGYSPKAKSDRRLRYEAAMADFPSSATLRPGA